MTGTFARVLLIGCADMALLAGIIVLTPGMDWARRLLVYGCLTLSRVCYRLYAELQ